MIPSIILAPRDLEMMPVPDQLGRRSPRGSSRRRFPYSDQDSPQQRQSSAQMSSFGTSVTSTTNPAFQGVNQDISQEEEREIRALPQPPSLPQRQSEETIPKQATINKKRRAPQPPSVQQLERIYEEASSVNPYGHETMTTTAVAEIHNQN